MPRDGLSDAEAIRRAKTVYLGKLIRAERGRRDVVIGIVEDVYVDNFERNSNAAIVLKVRELDGLDRHVMPIRRIITFPE